MSCVILTLPVHVYCVTNYASIRLCQPNFKIHALNRQGYFLINCSILKESCSYCNNPEKIKRKQASVTPPPPPQAINKITEIPRFDFLKQMHVLLTCHAVLDVMNIQFIVCKHVFDSLAVKKASHHQKDHG